MNVISWVQLSEFQWASDVCLAAQLSVQSKMYTVMLQAKIDLSSFTSLSFTSDCSTHYLPSYN